MRRISILGSCCETEDWRPKHSERRQTFFGTRHNASCLSPMEDLLSYCCLYHFIPRFYQHPFHSPRCLHHLATSSGLTSITPSTFSKLNILLTCAKNASVNPSSGKQTSFVLRLFQLNQGHTLKIVPMSISIHSSWPSTMILLHPKVNALDLWLVRHNAMDPANLAMLGTTLSYMSQSGLELRATIGINHDSPSAILDEVSDSLPNGVAHDA